MESDRDPTLTQLIWLEIMRYEHLILINIYPINACFHPPLTHIICHHQLALPVACRYASFTCHCHLFSFEQIQCYQLARSLKKKIALTWRQPTNKWIKHTLLLSLLLVQQWYLLSNMEKTNKTLEVLQLWVLERYMFFNFNPWKFKMKLHVEVWSFDIKIQRSISIVSKNEPKLTVLIG